mmetsp:Transcript_25559/g.80005  ORF Transcript_25559/g.80005 Transcript_25559/m.80005 type:complete len:294 (-) Transcript_25559:358-1239(-)
MILGKDSTRSSDAASAASPLSSRSDRISSSSDGEITSTPAVLRMKSLNVTKCSSWEVSNTIFGLGTAAETCSHGSSSRCSRSMRSCGVVMRWQNCTSASRMGIVESMMMSASPRSSRRSRTVCRSSPPTRQNCEESQSKTRALRMGSVVVVVGVGLPSSTGTSGDLAATARRCARWSALAEICLRAWRSKERKPCTASSTSRSGSVTAALRAASAWPSASGIVASASTTRMRRPVLVRKSHSSVTPMPSQLLRLAYLWGRTSHQQGSSPCCERSRTAALTKPASSKTGSTCSP